MDQIEWWLRHFSPDRFLLINHEELQSDPEGVIDRTITFLGQDPRLKAPLKVSKNVNS